MIDELGKDLDSFSICFFFLGQGFGSSMRMGEEEGYEPSSIDRAFFLLVVLSRQRGGIRDEHGAAGHGFSSLASHLEDSSVRVRVLGFVESGARSRPILRAKAT
jgi:hypothetical protein